MQGRQQTQLAAARGGHSEDIGLAETEDPVPGTRLPAHADGRGPATRPPRTHPLLSGPLPPMSSCQGPPAQEAIDRGGQTGRPQQLEKTGDARGRELPSEKAPCLHSKIIKREHLEKNKRALGN